MCILPLWTELGSSGVLDCTVDRLLFFHVQNIAGWPYQKKNPNILSYCKMELTFFLPFSGALLALIAVLCPQKASGTSSCQGLSGVCLPTRAVPSPGPLQELPPRGGEVSLCSTCHRCAGTALLRFTCCVCRGMVQSLRWQGQLYCLIRLGQGCPSPALLVALGSFLGTFAVGGSCS